MTSNAGLDRIDIDESHRNAVRQNAAEIAEVARIKNVTAHVLRLIGGATSYAALKRMASDLVSERKASSIVTTVESWTKTGQTPEELAGQVELIIRGLGDRAVHRAAKSPDLRRKPNTIAVASRIGGASLLVTTSLPEISSPPCASLLCWPTGFDSIESGPQF